MSKVTLNFIEFNAEGGKTPPQWLMLAPIENGQIKTRDNRGPFKIKNPQAVINYSFEAFGNKLPIDQNHATDLAAPKGGPSPAAAWIVEMQSREDGIWGRVEWTDQGKQLLSAYKGISPVFYTNSKKEILSIARASLVNIPNLEGMPSLNQKETSMTLDELRTALGLGTDADKGAVMAAIKKIMGDDTADEGAALNQQMAALRTALGIKDEKADFQAILNAVETAVKATGEETGEEAPETPANDDDAGGDDPMQKELNALKEDLARGKAEAFVDGAIKDGRVGVKPARDSWISLHMQDAETTEKMINAQPLLKGGALIDAHPPAAKGGGAVLNAEEKKVANQMGISHEDFAKSKAQLEKGDE